MLNWSSVVVLPTDYWSAWPARLTATEAADILRIKSMNTLYDWLAEGRIPAHKIGGAWVIFRDPLREALEHARPGMVYPEAYWAEFPEFMNAKELAEFIGLSYTATIRILKAGDPSSQRQGRALLVTKANAVDFMKRHANRRD